MSPTTVMKEPLRIFVDVRDEQGRVSRVAVDSTRAIIGRSYRAHIRLDREDVSRQHAELYTDAQGDWWVRDLQSMNGISVNGQQATETRVHPGDQIQIGDYFTLTLGSHHVAKIIAEAADEPADRSDPALDKAEFTSLDAGPSPKVDTAHVHTLAEMGRRLSDEANDQERRRLLCRTLVRRDFQAMSAMVLKVSKDSHRIPPEVIAEQRASSFNAQGDYISRNLLRAVRRTHAPVLASNVSVGQGEVEISLAPQTAKMAAIASPLSETEHFMEVLYVVLPHRLGTPEWLAVMALAVKQYEQAVGYWRLREEAKRHAALEQTILNARAVQRQLNPPDVVVGDLHAAVMYRMCKWVGGDVAAVLPTGDGQVLVALARVEGAELRAALAKLRLISLLQAHASDGIDLASIARRLDAQFTPPPGPGVEPAEARDATRLTGEVRLLLMRLSPGRDEVEAVSADFPSPLLVLPDGTTRWAEVPAGGPLGRGDGRHVVTRLPLPMGAVLAAWSDGLAELKDSSGHAIGREGVATRLSPLVAAGHATPAAGLRDQFDRLIEELDDAAVRRSDRSLLILKRIAR